MSLYKRNLHEQRPKTIRQYHMTMKLASKMLSWPLGDGSRPLRIQKKWRKEWPMFFSDQTRLPAHFAKEIVAMKQWFEMGIRWHCYGNDTVDQERCKVWGRLRLLSRMTHTCLVRQALVSLVDFSAEKPITPTYLNLPMKEMSEIDA